MNVNIRQMNYSGIYDLPLNLLPRNMPVTITNVQASIGDHDPWTAPFEILLRAQEWDDNYCEFLFQIPPKVYASRTSTYTDKQIYDLLMINADPSYPPYALFLALHLTCIKKISFNLNRNRLTCDLTYTNRSTDTQTVILPM